MAGLFVMEVMKVMVVMGLAQVIPSVEVMGEGYQKVGKVGVDFVEKKECMGI